MSASTTTASATTSRGNHFSSIVLVAVVSTGVSIATLYYFYQQMSSSSSSGGGGGSSSSSTYYQQQPASDTKAGTKKVDSDKRRSSTNILSIESVSLSLPDDDEEEEDDVDGNNVNISKNNCAGSTRSSSNSAQEVIIKTCDGMAIEGTMIASSTSAVSGASSSKDDVAAAAFRDSQSQLDVVTATVARNAICLVVDNEPTMVTFVAKQDETAEPVHGYTNFASKEDESPTCLASDNVSTTADGQRQQAQVPVSSSSRQIPTSSRGTIVGLNTSDKAKSIRTLISERRHTRDWSGSEAVIMISTEDMAMVADLMHLMHSEDDAEFFDCDDDENDSYNNKTNNSTRRNENYRCYSNLLCFDTR